MAELIGSYSVETLNVATNSVLVDQDVELQFEENLKSITDVLKPQSKKKKIERRHIIPSDDKLFKE